MKREPTTCIAAIAQDGNVWMGGDSLEVCGWSQGRNNAEKVYIRNKMIYGFTGLCRVAHFLRFSFDRPRQYEDEDNETFLNTRFVDELAKAAKDKNIAELKDNELSLSGGFLLGYKGTLYSVDGSFYVAKCKHPFEAVGCGGEYAMGSLYQTIGSEMTPKHRILEALKAAEEFSPGVRGPFTVLKLEGEIK